MSDILFTAFTDSVELYRTRLMELTESAGNTRNATRPWISNGSSSAPRPITSRSCDSRPQSHPQPEIFHLGGTAGKDRGGAERLWTPSFWEDLAAELPRLDEHIAAFNASGREDLRSSCGKESERRSTEEQVRTPATGTSAGCAEIAGDIVRFLRELIAIPAESCREGERCERVRTRIPQAGFRRSVFRPARQRRRADWQRAAQTSDGRAH